ncbi:hypothetical protein LTR62_003308 [Meristemomyces frigidus]|uniref:Uncharacterized protein n=1 Tax=Meristemomyces frigidus TaxID=1508187 RepID=A0AAN7TJ58_9PEZI|nr:hypothetical protein LTR62_003308 [Meristemomyces frigidus]
MPTDGLSSSIGGQGPTAADVSFQRLAEHHHGESSSQVSARSEGRRSKSREEVPGRGSIEVKSTTKETHRRSLDESPENISSAKRDRNSGGFLLDTTELNGNHKTSSFLPHRDGKRKAQNDYLHIKKRTDYTGSRLSTESSLGSSPLSREVSHEHHGSRPLTLEPAQLVQMALELGKSRRRQGSGKLVTSPRERRQVSGLKPTDAVKLRLPSEQRTSYMSDDGAGQTPPPPGESSQSNDHGNMSLVYDGTASNSEAYDFSPATISRAERARKYFELASEHRRLLQTLPPLKPDEGAPGNHSFTAVNSPGSDYPQITRIPSYAGDKYDLGRPYNPLQALRNRRLRNRERQALPAPIEAWQDADRIVAWVDEVEAAAERREYRSTADHVALPVYDGDDGGISDQRDTPKGHRRTDTVSSVITRPGNGWSIEPSELLADTYWTEVADNKALVEDRRGTKLFPNIARRFLDDPRQSRESGRISSGQRSPDPLEPEDIPFYKRAHRAGHFLPRRHKVLPRSGSVSSISSAEGRALPPLITSFDDDHENIGPLEKQMQRLIAQEEQASTRSPELLSPDHWDSKHTPFPKSRTRRDTLSQGHAQEQDAVSTSRLSVDTARQHRRAKSADGRGRVGDDRVSRDYQYSSDARSPTISGLRSSLDIDRSSPDDYQSLMARHKSKLHRLPFMRPRSKDRNGTERTDFAAMNGRVSPAEDGFHVEQRNSQESGRPSFMQRQRTDDSVTGSFHRDGTGLASGSGSAKEPPSVVGRLLKGGRVGDLVRNESSRLTERFRTKDRVSDLEPQAVREDSDTDEDSELRTNQSGNPSPRTSMDSSRQPKTKYYLPNLPTFKSPMGRNDNGTPSPGESGGPIARQQQEQKDTAKPSRFGNLPRINLQTVANGEVEEVAVDESASAKPDDDRRKSYGFLGQNSQGSSHISFGGAEVGHAGQPGRSHAQRGRHWSISDQRLSEPPAQSKVTMRDVARVKALLLSSGIKAREIKRRAALPREEPLALHTAAQSLVGKDLNLRSLMRCEDHLIVSRALADYLSTAISDCEKNVTRLQRNTTSQLIDRLDALGRKAGEELSSTVHETSDDADAFIVELTTRAPQDVKRVDDAVNEILRQRRRQFRLLKRAGFKILEWLVLGIMWWVWFLVVLFNGGKRLVLAVFGILRWLLWW